MLSIPRYRTNSDNWLNEWPDQYDSELWYTVTRFVPLQLECFPVLILPTCRHSNSVIVLFFFVKPHPSVSCGFLIAFEAMRLWARVPWWAIHSRPFSTMNGLFGWDVQKGQTNFRLAFNTETGLKQRDISIAYLSTRRSTYSTAFRSIANIFCAFSDNEPAKGSAWSAKKSVNAHFSYIL